MEPPLGNMLPHLMKFGRGQATVGLSDLANQPVNGVLLHLFLGALEGPDREMTSLKPKVEGSQEMPLSFGRPGNTALRLPLR